MSDMSLETPCPRCGLHPTERSTFSTYTLRNPEGDEVTVIAETLDLAKRTVKPLGWSTIYLAGLEPNSLRSPSEATDA